MSRTFSPSRSLRLDQAIAESPLGISRRAARKHLAEHRVLVNEHPVGIASRNVSPADRITVLDEGAKLLPILAMTDEWIAVDKSAGIATQPTRQRSVPSLIEQLAAQLRKANERPDLFLVHRLDTGTTGVVVFARTRESAARLSDAFARREVRKTYLAVVEGSVKEPLFIDDPIARENESSFGISPDGKVARTRVAPLASTDSASLISVQIDTGRSHQIRVHLASRNHAIFGDRKYAPATARPAPRLMLHAWKLEHPLLGSLESAPTEDFRKFVETLGVSTTSLSSRAASY